MNLRDMVGEPDTLSAFELDLDNELVTYDPKPKKGRAWVRYAGRSMKVNVYVAGTTDYSLGALLGCRAAG